jgi:hypothetical protein
MEREMKYRALFALCPIVLLSAASSHAFGPRPQQPAPAPSPSEIPAPPSPTPTEAQISLQPFAEHVYYSIEPSDAYLCGLQFHLSPDGKHATLSQVNNPKNGLYCEGSPSFWKLIYPLYTCRGNICTGASGKTHPFIYILQFDFNGNITNSQTTAEWCGEDSNGFVKTDDGFYECNLDSDRRGYPSPWGGETGYFQMTEQTSNPKPLFFPYVYSTETRHLYDQAPCDLPEVAPKLREAKESVMKECLAYWKKCEVVTDFPELTNQRGDDDHSLAWCNIQAVVKKAE